MSQDSSEHDCSFNPDTGCTTGYLREGLLGQILRYLFGEDDIQPQYCFDENRRWKFDFLIKSKKILVEYDGDSHYTHPDVIYRDGKKMEIATRNGFSVIRIPYWIQLDAEVFKHKFSFESPKPLFSEFAHGFITSKVVLPSRFCPLGVLRYKRDLELLPETIRSAVLESLSAKELQFPPCLVHETVTLQGLTDLIGNK